MRSEIEKKNSEIKQLMEEVHRLRGNKSSGEIKIGDGGQQMKIQQENPLIRSGVDTFLGKNTNLSGFPSQIKIGNTIGDQSQLRNNIF